MPYADTSQGPSASATCYSLVEADTLEKLKTLLPWSMDLERDSKKVSQID
ncbi:hypothetical protein MRBBS_0322 [Marinobacter sp. BSs20148]|nr:hypothetical protein MRBBS_0322 [Marinobacter sp. BSs20148]